MVDNKEAGGDKAPRCATGENEEASAGAASIRGVGEKQPSDYKRHQQTAEDFTAELRGNPIALEAMRALVSAAGMEPKSKIDPKLIARAIDLVPKDARRQAVERAKNVNVSGASGALKAAVWLGSQRQAKDASRTAKAAAGDTQETAAVRGKKKQAYEDALQALWKERSDAKQSGDPAAPWQASAGIESAVAALWMAPLRTMIVAHDGCFEVDIGPLIKGRLDGENAARQSVLEAVADLEKRGWLEAIHFQRTSREEVVDADEWLGKLWGSGAVSSMRMEKRLHTYTLYLPEDFVRSQCLEKQAQTLFGTTMHNRRCQIVWNQPGAGGNGNRADEGEAGAGAVYAMMMSVLLRRSPLP